MTKIKLIEVYWDCEMGEAILKEHKNMNKLDFVELMDFQSDLLHEVSELASRCWSKAQEAMKKISGE